MGFERYKIGIRPGDPWDSPVNTAIWEKEVTTILNKIENVKTGRIVLESIGAGVKWVAIERLLDANECNAHGGPRPQVKFGGVVKFNADVFHLGGRCVQMKNGPIHVHKPGQRYDEVFFHELIHARRGALGLRAPDAFTGGMFRFTNLEEFLAVLVTNVYISDVTNKPSRFLRAGHTSHNVLENSLSGSIAFYKVSTQAFATMEKLEQQENKLFHDLAKVKAWFNPFWAFVRSPNEVKNASRSDLAKWNERHNEALQKATIKSNYEAMKVRRDQMRDAAAEKLVDTMVKELTEFLQ